jgi:hypothetical protein
MKSYEEKTRYPLFAIPSDLVCNTLFLNFPLTLCNPLPLPPVLPLLVENQRTTKRRRLNEGIRQMWRRQSEGFRENKGRRGGEARFRGGGRVKN